MCPYTGHCRRPSLSGGATGDDLWAEPLGGFRFAARLDVEAADSDVEAPDSDAAAADSDVEVPDSDAAAADSDVEVPDSDFGAADSDAGTAPLDVGAAVDGWCSRHWNWTAWMT